MSEAACKIEKCKRPYRAKGYCNVHYKKWRQGEYGKARYDTCRNESCRKPEKQSGLCEEHWNAKVAKKMTAAGAAAPAPAAASPAPAANPEAAPVETPES